MDRNGLSGIVEKEVRGKEDDLAVATISTCLNILPTSPFRVSTCISHCVYHVPSPFHLPHPAPPHGPRPTAMCSLAQSRLFQKAI